MSLDTATRERIESLIASKRVVLFMKGTPAQPQCGFSARTVGILNSLVSDYDTFNVLADQEIREGIKAFSDWPTIPQLYVDGEFQGGCDLVTEMFNRGDLHQLFGLPGPDRTPPAVTISDAAAEMMSSALDDNPGMHVHVSIDGQWQHNFQLGPAGGHEVRSGDNGIELLMDLQTAQRARGLRLDVTEGLGGTSLAIDNPNMPPAVKDMSVQALNQLRQSGAAHRLIDVRTPEERGRAVIEGSVLLEQGSSGEIERLEKATMLVFYCHTGVRSAQAAEHFRLQGFSNVYNVVGGIDAWSREVDSSVPAY
ncbi:MAG: Grx4 family monothiol glutaredoxin [Gammaproteobacteria bacterium]|nr:Grx4 family monothiol glutaredoxin [Gammaproteobacteria bacterium]